MKLLSLPLRERGLKFFPVAIIAPSNDVAPLAGAWIEIYEFRKLTILYFVAPLAGAWIEIHHRIL